MFRIGPQVGAERTGTTLYHLPPGELLCPYHYEYGEEEWLLVLSGRPFLRTPTGTEELEADGRGLLPARARTAPTRSATGRDEPARVLMWSEVTYPSATSYPDSDKVGVWTGVKPEDLIVERSSNVDYYRGET